jgi:hypothetical protein
MGAVGELLFRVIPIVAKASPWLLCAKAALRASSPHPHGIDWTTLAMKEVLRVLQPAEVSPIFGRDHSCPRGNTCPRSWRGQQEDSKLWKELKELQPDFSLVGPVR